MKDVGESRQTAAQRKADYERYRLEKSAILRRSATAMGVWHCCQDKACRRSQSCTGANPSLCMRHVVQDVLSEEERAIFRLALQLRAAGADVDDALREATRRCAVHAASDEAAPIAATMDAHSEALVAPAGKLRPEPVAVVVEDDAARAARVRRVRAQPKRGLTPLPPR